MSRKSESLEDLLGTVGSTVEMLRNAPIGPNVYPGVQAEYTNWRDEQWAWQNTCVLYNQSFHMADLAVERPDALALLSHLGVNSFAGFAPGKAKHFVPCTPDGYVIGDVILFALDEGRYNLVGRAPALNWVTYHAETGGYDVVVTLDQRTALRTDGRRASYRFQVQGPSAMQVVAGALGQEPPELAFFTMTTVGIAGREVNALRHGMAGQSGWIPSPLPAVYSGASLKAYREWLPASGYEGRASVGGSFVSDAVEDYLVDGGRRDGRCLDLDRLQRERGEDAHPRRRRRRARRAGHRGDVRLGRGRRRHEGSRRWSRTSRSSSARS